MITFTLNGVKETYTGNPEETLLNHLRLGKHITSVKDGCSGQAVCGACTVEIDGKAKLACVIKIKTLDGTEIFTPEGFPEYVKDTIAKAFVNKGAVQCGFCSPGFISRTKVLLQDNPNPSVEEIQKAIKPHICRCTGYKKIEDAIIYAGKAIRENKKLEITKTSGKIGVSQPKYDAYRTALGERPFVDDLFFDGMLFAALKMSDYPKAKVLKIDVSKAEKIQGVHKIYTAKDIPREKKVGLIYKDWSVMIGESETTHYIGDVIAGVVAESDEIAREAVKLIQVDYEVYKPETDVFKAIEGERVHPDKPNNFNTTQFTIGNADEALKNSKYISKGKYETQRIEHAFLEKEAALARPDGKGGLELFSQSQGVYEDRRQVAMILGLPEEKVRVTLVPNGGGFGGKEDLSVQGQTALFAYLTRKPVKLTLTREESIRLHPKRHPVFMDIEIGANENGMLTALKLRAVGDTGAYASVGTKVLERVAGHAAGGYFIPDVDIEAKTVYTNNIPCGAMRGFGANQVCFALESCIDDICKQAGFDRWQFRYDNALTDGLKTSTGQKVFGVGIRACLEAVKDDFNNARHAGLACAIKNSGVGNGMIDESKVIIEILSENHIRLQHGWTEMGQGVHNMALQTLCEEIGVLPDIIEVIVDTEAQIKTGMTTSSRATALVGLAVINAAKAIKEDLKTKSLKDLTGKSYKGQFVCDWTTKPGSDVDEQITHYSYGYAAQVCILDEKGNISKMIAAHDGGKIMNPMLFEGQIEGGVHMGLGYALSEDLPMKDGYLVSDKMRDLQILRAHETPKIVVKMVEVKDPIGPYGAKGIGEIGLVPTAAAVANAFYQFDGIKRYKLPLKRK
ncbi:MAG: selenium-dependent xanthine dehydrogenase [Bacteroidetes bacterium GWC2_33_15]|nr:MAG: selenium-dependent xanthine dehydrogenase [Bacteroidetes bacterium GWA2_33_15]OFX48603.1 MAG: selenium-dependent xanthine dehydrogenase [Bacteroidetes bacterium GWC2_33_15]OFX64577.1 MAG: selenium-dependent xanthine dehydrogenase [Bacteroidetes bacterium GWB2_32_14]OFX68005.1 MAG: selenium-dependent xanthine dehydrogenase [Bacteroidetes bacterium GWD2_33_33]HAN18240.1 selenium-dependent xanthine dehydrogenase [Bacteroidales bacterium]